MTTPPSVCVVGSGPAGLITAHVLLQDGFDVQVLTKDRSPGGVWADERVYPNLALNNVHGEFRFSSLPMPPPANAKATGGRLSGDDMQGYFERYSERFLSGRIRFDTAVLNVRRREQGLGWVVRVQIGTDDSFEDLNYDKLVLCTGGCSEPSIPHELMENMARQAGFKGPVLHSQQFKAMLDAIMKTVNPEATSTTGTVVIVGGGKSAQDIAAYLAKDKVKVRMVFDKADTFIAAPFPLPAFIRKSRLLSIMSPHIHPRTRLEQFLHTTWLGGWIVRGFWSIVAQASFATFSIPANFPLRRAQHPLFWGIRLNDEGNGRPDGFYESVNAGKIDLISPARVSSFGQDGRSVVLNDGRRIDADAVVLCTGYTSSWAKILDPNTMEELGLSRQPPSEQCLLTQASEWNYSSLSRPPPAHPVGQQWSSSIYRGLVPYKNLFNRDFAINGAIFTTNNGYTFETCAHWISSYFLNDPFLKLPSSIEKAQVIAQRNGAWLRKRYPDTLLWTNESYSADIAFFTYPQLNDTLLEDMGLRSGRSGGNWLTWPFTAVDLDELKTLTQERRAKRMTCTQ